MLSAVFSALGHCCHKCLVVSIGLKYEVKASEERKMAGITNAGQSRHLAPYTLYPIATTREKSQERKIYHAQCSRLACLSLFLDRSH
jgi:hypothetical protein